LAAQAARTRPYARLIADSRPDLPLRTSAPAVWSGRFPIHGALMIGRRRALIDHHADVAGPGPPEMSSSGHGPSRGPRPNLVGLFRRRQARCPVPEIRRRPARRYADRVGQHLSQTTGRQQRLVSHPREPVQPTTGAEDEVPVPPDRRVGAGHEVGPAQLLLELLVALLHPVPQAVQPDDLGRVGRGERWSIRVRRVRVREVGREMPRRQWW
jgi:hypothetical protein